MGIHEEKMRPAGRIFVLHAVPKVNIGRIFSEQRVALMLQMKAAARGRFRPVAAYVIPSVRLRRCGFPPRLGLHGQNAEKYTTNRASPLVGWV